jgi:chromosome segregation ATPase
MGNTESTSCEIEDKSNVIYEFVDLDSNLKVEYDKFKKEYDLLKNDLYCKNNIINNLNEKLLESEINNKSLIDKNQILENQLKTTKNDYNLLKNNYNNLEYTKLELESNNLKEIDNNECIEYLKNNINTLEEENKVSNVNFNDEKQKNTILNKTLKEINKELNKYKNLYNKSQVDYDSLKSNNQQLNKEYKDLLKKNKFHNGNIQNNLTNKSLKKKLYQSINSKIKSEPYVINLIIDEFINIIINKINN